jgi:large subunit ribosomal protein L9
MNFLKSKIAHFQSIQRSYTCVVERVNQPGLVKKGTDPRKFNLKQQHYYYKLVKCEQTKKWGDMQVILTKYIEGLGREGELLSVPRSLAHLKLLPTGMAIYPTKDNLNLYKEKIEDASKKPKLSKFCILTRQYLEKTTFELQMNIREKWSLNKDLVRITLRYNGVMVDNDSITLPDNYEQINCAGDNESYYSSPFTCIIKINDFMTAKAKIKVVPSDTVKLWETFTMLNKK